MKAEVFNAIGGRDVIPVDAQLALMELQSYVDGEGEGTRGERLRAVQPQIYSLVGDALLAMASEAVDQAEGSEALARIGASKDDGSKVGAREILEILNSLRNGRSTYEPQHFVDGSVFITDTDPATT